MTNPTWLDKAASYIGFHEVGNNRGIEHFIQLAHTGELGDPWCAIFANACLEEAGFPGTRSPAARSFENDANFVKLDGPALGAIVTNWRNSPSSGQGHVYFYVGENDHGIVGLGGNQDDQVCEGYESPERVTGYYWPKTAPLPTVGAIHRDSLSDTPATIPSATEGWQYGKGSWYSQYQGKYSWVDTGDEPGSAAYHVNGRPIPDDQQGCAFYTRATLGDWFEVKAPNGVTLTIQHTDVGPNPRTGRTIDIAAAAAERFGYTPRNFPTDGVFQWRSASKPATQPQAPTVPSTELPAMPPHAFPAPQGIDPNLLKLLTAAATVLTQPAVQTTIMSVLDKVLLGSAGLGAGPVGIIGVAAVFALNAFGVIGTHEGVTATQTGTTLLASAGAVTGLGVFSKIDSLISTIKSRVKGD